MKQQQERGEGAPTREDTGGPRLMDDCRRSIADVPLPLASLCTDPAQFHFSNNGGRESAVRPLSGTKLRASCGLSSVCCSHLLSSSVLHSHLPFQSRPQPIAALSTCSQPHLPGCLFKGQAHSTRTKWGTQSQCLFRGRLVGSPGQAQDA